MTKKWTTFTSIGSQDSLDKNKNFCGHSQKHEKSQYCGYCLEYFCHDCYRSHSARFHPITKSLTSEVPENNFKIIEQNGIIPNRYISTGDKIRPQQNAGELSEKVDRLSLDDVQCNDDKTNSNLSDFEKITYETSLSFLEIKDVVKSNQLSNSLHHNVSSALDSTPHQIQNHTRISGLELCGDLLLATDYCNKRVMVIDTSYYNLVSQYCLTTSPWDITLVEKSHIAVTLTFERKIVFLRLQQSKLIFDRDLNVSGYCDGITAYGEMIVLTMVNPGSVVFTDHHGNVIKTVMTGVNGKRLFDEPRHAAFSINGDRVYVSDFQRNRVLSIESHTECVTEYKSIHLKGPENITVDKNGSVYVCASSSNSIHILSAECQQLYVLYNEHIKYPQSLYCCLATMKLYVGLDGDTDILVFQLIRQKNKRKLDDNYID